MRRIHLFADESIAAAFVTGLPDEPIIRHGRSIASRTIDPAPLRVIAMAFEAGWQARISNPPPPPGGSTVYDFNGTVDDHWAQCDAWCHIHGQT